jgi:WD40 repeat protein
LGHPKGLSSAFFSPAGKYVVTTCNDDCLRVYDVTNMLTTRPNGTFKRVIYFYHIYEKRDRTGPELCIIVDFDISGFKQWGFFSEGFLAPLPPSNLVLNIIPIYRLLIIP